MTLSIKIAYHIPSESFIHIKQAKNGSKCECKCPDPNCNENLDAIQGDIREWHFRHQGDKACSGAQETALHQLGKQILVESNQIVIPKYGTIIYSEPIAETNLLSIRPDVTANYNEEKIYFEIAVKHFLEPSKKEFLASGQHTCVEIDLSKVDIASYEEIKGLVLHEISNKSLIGWDIPIQAHKSWISPLGKFVIFVVGFFTLRWLFTRDDD